MTDDELAERTLLVAGDVIAENKRLYEQITELQNESNRALRAERLLHLATAFEIGQYTIVRYPTGFWRIEHWGTPDEPVLLAEYDNVGACFVDLRARGVEIP